MKRRPPVDWQAGCRGKGKLRRLGHRRPSAATGRKPKHHLAPPSHFPRWREWRGGCRTAAFGCGHPGRAWPLTHEATGPRAALRCCGNYGWSFNSSLSGRGAAMRRRRPPAVLRRRHPRVTGRLNGKLLDLGLFGRTGSWQPSQWGKSKKTEWEKKKNEFFERLGGGAGVRRRAPGRRG